MIPMTSRLQNQEAEYQSFKEALEKHQFTLGGNWDYEHGCFDRFLDDKHMVWLRIPFRVTSGDFDGESGMNQAWVKLGQPYVLKHVYNDGLDPEAVPMVYAGLVNQFQDPINPDAEIEPHWLNVAKKMLAQVEEDIHLKIE